MSDACNLLYGVLGTLIYFSLGDVSAEHVFDGDNNSTSAMERNSKQLFFGYYGFGTGLVRFENSECTGSNGLIGSCVRRRQCSTADGIGSSSCASGIGICCIINRSCGESSSYNNTYFVSPGFPNIYSTSTLCSHTIEKSDSDICQVRIDFLTLRLAQPDSNGTCTTDALFVSGGGANVPILCGDNTGQHVYVDFNGDTNIVITISTAGSSSTAWNIKVSQINCNCPQKAPAGCLQFYNATSGTVRSFNYGSAPSLNGTRQLVNLNYGVCIATINKYCGIQWSESGTNTFSLSGDTYTAISDGTIGTIAGEIFGTACTTDFVVIPAPILSSNSTVLTGDRFCGNGFATVLSYSKPFVLTVVTDSNENSDIGNRGFSLDFSLVRCSGSVLLG